MKNRSDIDFQHDIFQKVLRKASLEEHTDLVEFLLKNGVPVNKNGSWLLAIYGRLVRDFDTVKMLMKKEADQGTGN
jgi:hypothetical protein